MNLRRHGLPLGLAVVGGGLTAIALAVADAPLATLVIMAGLVALVLGGLTWTALALRRLQHMQVTSAERTAAAVTDVRKTQERHGALLRDMHGAVTGPLERRTAAMVRSSAKLDTVIERGLVSRDDLVTVQNRLIRAGRDDTRQIEAYLGLLNMAKPHGFMPGTRGWAASADFLLLLADHVDRGRPRLVVDLGSGLTTVWTALILRSLDSPGRIVSIDHDPEYLARTAALLAAHGLSDSVDLRLAPLIDRGSDDDGPDLWYDPSALAGLENIDLLCIDGPPQSSGPLARWPALEVLHEALASDAVVLLDDAARDDERVAVTRWTQQFPDLTAEFLDLEKGAVILRRQV